MKEKNKKFFSILLVELSDLEDNLTMLIDSAEERFKKHEITGYVWTENTALLKRERTLMGIIRTRVSQLNPSAYETLTEAKVAVLEVVNTLDGFPEAVPSFIEKRIEKVRSYLEEY